ncbi:CHAT domain-containing protein [Adonisia turfae]|uniref:CHAT domain-containing protein n=1 Tax=Adonisia turfae CCMR0081 TaxID=2292702 RepID=A0A6M0REH1_9CYAN|nr:CHAT domain-containing protein [Adonisia turfae CCMR0081]
MLQEFDISITAVGDNRYLVRTEQVAPGVPLAQEQFHWPIDSWLAEASNLMHDPLLGILKGESSQRWAFRSNVHSSSDGDDDSSGSQPPTLVSLGQALYNSVFDKALRDSWLTAQGIAQHRRSPLRLRLGLKGEKLQKLPWEVLHAGDRPLGTGTDVTFSRYHLGRRQGYDRPVATVPDFDQPLRVLMVIAAPNDQDRLELAREANHLKNELHPLSMRSGDDYNLLPKQQLDVQLTVLEQPDRSELTQALEHGRYQVLHYAGHSNLGNAGGDLYLVSRQTGLTERISGEDLAGLLSNNGVKLAVLNSCRGAYSQGQGSELGWHEQNLANALVNRGIPGVIAMAERIPDDVAITFTRLLYRNLKQGNPIDLCLNRTRQGLISAHDSNYSYWALPILYMQPGFDGYLASKPGNHNSALDKLLSESETALAALEEHPPKAVDAAIVVPKRSATDPDALENIDLDSVVETVELEEILDYNEEDVSTMTELVEQLSQASTSDEVPLAEVDESLLPETLETPGLDLHDQLPQKPDSPPLAESDDGASIYDHGDDGTTYGAKLPEDNVPQLVERSVKDQASGRRKRQLAIGIGALAATIAVAGVGINDPFKWFEPPSSQPTTTPPSSELLAISGIASGNPESAVMAINEMAAVGDQDKALNQLLALGQIEDPALLFSKGQLQWALMNQNPSIDNSIGPAEAARSWKDALDAQPDWLDAQVALGFAYYESGFWEDAIATWKNALGSGQDYDIPIVTLGQIPQDVDLQNAPTKLHAQIGLAMAYYQQSKQGLTDDDSLPLLATAASHWQDVIESASDEDVTNHLSFHWLWSQKALQDWQEARQKIASYISQAN